MQRQRDGELVPIAEAFSDLSGPVAALRDASPQARHHFTQADQVNQLVSASEADPDLDRNAVARSGTLAPAARSPPCRGLFLCGFCLVRSFGSIQWTRRRPDAVMKTS